jgi:hypothetical protein
MVTIIEMYSVKPRADLQGLEDDPAAVRLVVARLGADHLMVRGEVMRDEG